MNATLNLSGMIGENIFSEMTDDADLWLTLLMQERQVSNISHHNKHSLKNFKFFLRKILLRYWTYFRHNFVFDILQVIFFSLLLLTSNLLTFLLRLYYRKESKYF
jgi:hypothetical protein